MTSRALAAMRAAAAAAHPHEACGLLLGSGAAITAVRAARNVHPAPATHFEIDPQALIDAHRAARAGGAQVIGYYHSHPAGPPAPSATDRACAAGDGRVWAIIAGDAVRFWRDGNAQGSAQGSAQGNGQGSGQGNADGGFAALSFTIIEG